MTSLLLTPPPYCLLPSSDSDQILSWITQQPPDHSLHTPPLLYLSHPSLLLPEWGSKVQLWCHPSRLACWGSRGGQWEMSSPSRTEQVPRAWLPTPSLLHLSLWWGPHRFLKRFHSLNVSCTLCAPLQTGTASATWHLFKSILSLQGPAQTPRPPSHPLSNPQLSIPLWPQKPLLYSCPWQPTLLIAFPAQNPSVASCFT